MTKICILNERFSDGGLSNVTKTIGQALSEENDVYFYSILKKLNLEQEYSSNFYSTNSRFTGDTFWEKVYRKTVYTYFKFFNDRKINFSMLYKKKITEFCNFTKKMKIDVVILSGGLLTSFIPSIKEQNPNLKIIAWQHNNADVYLDIYYNDILNSFKKGLNYADLVVCLTKYDKKIFSKFNQNTVTIYNPIVIDKSKGNYISNLSNKNIIFVSRYSIEQKGLDLLVKLAKEIPEGWKISFAGSGSSREVHKVKQMIYREGVENKIDLKGMLKGEELKKHYSEGSIFISTSRWEGFGLVLVEAMSIGLPVISFNTSGPKEILEEGKSGLLIPNFDIKKMGNAIKELASDKDLMIFWQNKSLVRADDFSIDSILKIWENEINKVLRGMDSV